MSLPNGWSDKVPTVGVMGVTPTAPLKRVEFQKIAIFSHESKDYVNFISGQLLINFLES